jgi:hypothetical protein
MIFERKGEASVLYTKPAERPAPTVDKDLVQSIQAIAVYEESGILQSFVQQLEKGRTLSPAQMAILQRKFGLGVSIGVETDKYVKLYEKLAKEIQDTYKAVIASLEDQGKQEEPGVKRLFDQAISMFEEDLAAAKKKKMLQRFTDHDTIIWYLRDALDFPVGPNFEGPVGYLARVGILATKGDAAPKTTLRAVKPIEKFERWMEHLGGRAGIHSKLDAYVKKQREKSLKTWP